MGGKKHTVCSVGCECSIYHHCVLSLLLLFNYYLQNKKKEDEKPRSFFFPSIFGYYGLYSSLQGFFPLSVFFVIFTVILSEFSQISLIWIFFFWKKVPEMILVLHMSSLYCFSDRWNLNLISPWRIEKFSRILAKPRKIPKFLMFRGP